MGRFKGQRSFQVKGKGREHVGRKVGGQGKAKVKKEVEKTFGA